MPFCLVLIEYALDLSIEISVNVSQLVGQILMYSAFADAEMGRTGAHCSAGVNYI